MSLEKDLLKAKSVGVRGFRDKLSKLMRTNEIFIVTDHGDPKSVLMPYDDVLEIVDILDELRDKDAVKAVIQGRKAVERGAKGIPAEEVFKKGKKAL
jgi:PHD/YefM family antitoxin component YafN of YafNO toxin-antitoxin module